MLDQNDIFLYWCQYKRCIPHLFVWELLLCILIWQVNGQKHFVNRWRKLELKQTSMKYLDHTNLSQRCWYQLLRTVYNRTMYTMGHPHCPFPAWNCRTLGYTQAFRAKACFPYSAMPRLRCLRTKRELNIYPLLIKGMCLTSLVHKMTSFYSKDQWWSHSQL